ncbi:MAG: ABC transporter permease [Bacteroidota bacterium]
MFDYDKWQEIFTTIKKNKLRTFLTVFGIFWGIFMIVILLGAGKGLENGIQRDFSAFATNSGFIWGQKTTISYDGYKPGRYIRYNNEDRRLLLAKVPELRYLAPRNQLSGFGGGNNVIYGENSGTFSVYGDYPDFGKIESRDIYNGRFINDLDIEKERKVAVIGENVRKVLFEEDEDPMGKYIQINRVNFQVVGVFKSLRSGERGDRDTQTIFVPFSTFQTAFHYGDRIGWFAYSAKEEFDAGEVEAKMIDILREQHSVHPRDEDAIGHFNLQEEFKEISGLFTGMNLFTWFVGISTLFAGIIGVSNIMLIIIKERTREIGIRKSLGATPLSIVSLVIQESVFLTTIGGYTALVFGIFLLEAINQVIPKDGFFGATEIDIQVAIGALLILIIGGAAAGILPATKAAKINPIEAIRTE